MRLLRPGQDIVLSWRSGAVECRVVAAAGQFVLLRPEHPDHSAEIPGGDCSLTYLDGMVPMGWDGSVEAAGHPGELRFRVGNEHLAADRRSSARVPVSGTVHIDVPGEEPMDSLLLDVSAGGMRFRTVGRLPAGTRLRVRTVLHEGLTVEADAVVRISEPGIASVEFTAMHGADAQAVGAWTVAILRASLAGQG